MPDATFPVGEAYNIKPLMHSLCYWLSTRGRFFQNLSEACWGVKDVGMPYRVSCRIVSLDNIRFSVCRSSPIRDLGDRSFDWCTGTAEMADNCDNVLGRVAGHKLAVPG